MAETVKLGAEQAKFSAEVAKIGECCGVPLATVAIAFMAGAGLAAIAIHFAR